MDPVLLPSQTVYVGPSHVKAISDISDWSLKSDSLSLPRLHQVIRGSCVTDDLDSERPGFCHLRGFVDHPSPLSRVRLYTLLVFTSLEYVNHRPLPQKRKPERCEKEVRAYLYYEHHSAMAGNEANTYIKMPSHDHAHNGLVSLGQLISDWSEPWDAICRPLQPRTEVPSTVLYDKDLFIAQNYRG